MAREVGASAADALLARKAELAAAITDALYAAMPELQEKHGDRGRAKCLQDMRYNLEHLAPAVALDDPSLFAGYAVWLRDLLASRGVAAAEVGRSLELTREIARARMPAEEVARSLELTRDVARARLPAGEAEAVGRAIAAGLAALAG